MVADRSSRTTRRRAAASAASTPSPSATRARRSTARPGAPVYDTINYTTTGTLGDWFDSSSRASNADGIDNEMSFSHLDKNIVFDPHTEQLHVDGNKALIYAHLAEILDPPSGPFDAPGARATCRTSGSRARSR